MRRLKFARQPVGGLWQAEDCAFSGPLRSLLFTRLDSYLYNPLGRQLGYPLTRDLK